jgi:hypothetical protein
MKGSFRQRKSLLRFREESIIARAKQILEVEGDSRSIIKKNFFLRIAKYHPDKCGSLCTEKAKVLIEAYDVLTGRVQPLDCKLLENDDLVASLLPKGVKPVKLGIRYEDWLKENFYDFVKP